MEANLMAEAKPEAGVLRDLAQLEGTCVSVYLGPHRAGSGSRPMSVRLRGMMSEAEQLLNKRGVLPTDRDALLEPLRARAASPELEGGHGEGLALFRTSRRLEQMRLPWEVDDLLVVEGRPFLMPLAHALDKRPNFFILALSKQNTRLFECQPGSHRELELPGGVERGLHQFEGFDKQEANLGQTGAGVKFGFDTFSDKEPLYLHDFFRALERAMQPLLEERNLPLVLAGAASEVAVYRNLCKYPLLAPQAVEGSPDGGWTEAQLAEKAREVMKGWCPPRERQASDMYLRAGPGKRADNLKAILRAAAEGRVMHLLLTQSDGEKGDVNRILGHIPMSGEPTGGEDHLVNAAAVETWRHGGEVWSVDEPLEGAATAAVLRW